MSYCIAMQCAQVMGLIQFVKSLNEHQHDKSIYLCCLLRDAVMRLALSVKRMLRDVQKKMPT